MKSYSVELNEFEIQILQKICDETAQDITRNKPKGANNLLLFLTIITCKLKKGLNYEVISSIHGGSDDSVRH